MLWFGLQISEKLTFPHLGCIKVVVGRNHLVDRRRSSNWIHFRMKLILVACVLIFVSESFAVEEAERTPTENIEILDLAEEESEPVVGIKKASPSMEYYRKPSPPVEYYRPAPCASNFMFSCQPIVRAVGCSQGSPSYGPTSYGRPSSYGSASLGAPAPPQFNRRAQRCSMPHQVSFNPILRPLY